MYRPLRVKITPHRTGDFAILPQHVLQAAEEGRFVQWKGHAAKPNTGPYPETCGGCANLYMHKDGKRGRPYPKCALRGVEREDGAKSDIAKQDPACLHWTKAQQLAPKEAKSRKPQSRKSAGGRA